jgi:riboflavin kinase/FMN adenylyltransferase
MFLACAHIISGSMLLYRTLASLSRHAPAPRVVTVGVFDGLHVGHQEIIAQTRTAAAEHGAIATVCSFEPMPTEYFAPHNPPPRLTCFRERIELLAELGIPAVFCPHFETVRDLTPDAFIAELLVAGLKARHVVIGHDFHFGAGRRGTAAYMNELGRRHGFGVTTVDPVFWRGERISSTAIRRALQSGDLASAKSMLGRDYAISGRVVHGRGLGRELGFPTANVNLKRRLAPVSGIFAVRVAGLGDALIDGVASVGSRPMLGGGKTLLEVYLFDFDSDIYGRYITVNFLARLREERTFPDLAAMQAQMRADVREARAALARGFA